MRLVKFTTRNGWTKARMIERIRERVPAAGAIEEVGGVLVCRYRTRDGHACGVGAFLSDEEAQLDAFRTNSDIAAVPYDVFDAIAFPLERMGMSRLQGVHDVETRALLERSVPDVLARWVEENVEDAP